ncbi:MAG: LamG domain-containing protein [Nanoarchaeota archaeon]
MKRGNRKGLSDTRERISLVSKRAIGKKALSDVVATVLIIFLVVAAVVAIWAFINPTLKSAGTGIQRGQVCLTSTVEPITCKGNGTDYNVAYRMTVDDSSVTSIDNLQFGVKLNDGGIVNANTSNVASEGSGNQKINTKKTADEVVITSNYVLKDGQKQACSSPALKCGLLSGSVDLGGSVVNPPVVEIDYTADLVAWWKMNEASWSANPAIDTIGGANGLPLPGATISVNGGKEGNAGNFDGTTGFISVSNTAPFARKNFTLSAWIKTNNILPQNIESRIFIMQPSGIPARHYSIGVVGASGGKVLLACGSLEDGFVFTPATQTNINLADNSWHHIACVRNAGKEFTWHIDGNNVKTLTAGITSNTYTTPSGSAVSIAAHSTAGGSTTTNYYKGLLDDVRVYSDALNDAEIKQVYDFRTP